MIEFFLIKGRIILLSLFFVISTSAQDKQDIRIPLQTIPYINIETGSQYNSQPLFVFNNDTEDMEFGEVFIILILAIAFSLAAIFIIASGD